MTSLKLRTAGKLMLEKKARKLILPAAFFFLLLTSFAALSQSGNPINEISFPAFEIQSLDSSTIIRTEKLGKTKPVVFLFFNTTCDHCQQEARDLLENKSKLAKVQLVMVSTESLGAIRNFHTQYSLGGIQHLIIGRDHRLTGSRHFMIESYPYCAIYSKARKYIKSLERNFNTENILQELKNKGEL